jgi:hypothetical protein
MVHRFSAGFPGPTPNDKEIMANAHQLKIRVWRHDDERVSVEFEIEGVFGKMADDEGTPTDSDGVAFAKRMLAEFTKGARPSEGAC